MRNAEVNKTADENRILVLSGSNFLFISLSSDKTKASLSYKGEIKYEFPIREFFGDLIVEASPTQKVETHMKMFTKVHRSLVQRLIFSLLSDYSVKSSTMRIVAQDEIFRLALQDTKNQFDKIYNFFKE